MAPLQSPRLPHQAHYKILCCCDMPLELTPWIIHCNLIEVAPALVEWTVQATGNWLVPIVTFLQLLANPRKLPIAIILKGKLLSQVIVSELRRSQSCKPRFNF